MRVSRAMAALLSALLGAAPVAADDNPSAVPPPVPAAADTVRVPDVRNLPEAEAAALLARSGLSVARLFDQRFETSYPVGTVVRQRPAPGVFANYGSGVDLQVMAAVSGPLEGRLPDPHWPRAVPRRVAPPPVPPVPPAPAPAATPPAATSPAPQPLPPPAAPASTSPGNLPPEPPATGTVHPGPTFPVPAPVPGASLPPAAEPLSGSPDAPAVAERATPGVVPDLKGLGLADAEQRVREAGLVLYVERVAGHPVGRVLAQVPEPGAARASGSVVSVTATAGGDGEGARPPPPAVEVLRVTVPDLLDRTPLQAGRILGALGLAMRAEPAVSGPAGCVVNQKPGCGAEVAKGSVVTVWATPPPAKAPNPYPTPAPEAQPRPTAPVPAAAAPAPPPTPPVPPASAAVAPTPVAPTEGTVMPKTRTVPAGFTWTPVAGADAYVLEVEERSGATWLANVRKPVRSSAAAVDVERLAPAAGDLRWRVRALVGGIEGTASAWVTLR